MNTTIEDSLFSYGVIEKKFYIEDFVFSFKHPYDNVLNILNGLINEGFFRKEEQVILTRAGKEALLGTLSLKKRLWWLIVETTDILSEPFLKITYNTYIAPFTWFLYNKIEKNVSQAYVVTGNIGIFWIKKYCSRKPFYNIKMAEKNLNKLKKMIEEEPININYANTIVRNVLFFIKNSSIILGIPVRYRIKNIKEKNEILNELRILDEMIKDVYRKLRDILK